jgi:hypothetical protein
MMCVSDGSDREVLRRQATLLALESKQELSHESERALVQNYYDEALAA